MIRNSFFNKKLSLLFTIILLFGFRAVPVEAADFYYYENASITLHPASDQLSVVFDPAVSTMSDMQSVLRKVLRSRMKEAGERISSHSLVVRLYSKQTDTERNTIIQDLQQNPQIQSAAPVYRMLRSHLRFTINQQVIVRFESGMDNKQIRDFATEKKVTLLKEIAGQTWLVEVTPKSGENGLSVANRLNDQPEVVWAQPNFIYLNYGILNSTVNDPLWSSQWAHVNTGQEIASGAGDLGFPASVNGYPDADMDVDLAWDVLAANGVPAGGSNSVLVAMLDSGVDLDHPDIQDNLYSTGKDFTSDGQSDANDTHGHGTCTAGIVAAVGDNSQGVAGVAYNVKILPVRIMNTWGITSSDQLAQAVDYAWQEGADILSNSWGGTTPEQVLTDAIHRAKTEGREGQGCVILFSSGNEGYGTVNYPGNLDDVIAVGASNMFDEKKNSGSQDYNRKWSANYGAALDVVAPTIVYAPDIQGADGYVDGDYFDHFGGTSAACPNAAGVAALILSANSAYTSDEVQNVLQESADKIDRYPYAASGWNKHVGYGRVNAYNAVRQALGEDGSAPLLVHEVPAPTRSIDPYTIQADITDNAGVATGENAPRLYYRTILGTDTSAWASVTDSDGPSGDTYSFIIPGQKWSTQIQYYFDVQDNSAQQNRQTYPAGGEGSTPPELFYTFHVGDFTSETFSQPTTVSWENNWQDYHTSTLDITEDYRIVDLNITIDYSGNLNEAGIDLSGPDSKGAGLAMYYEGSALSNTTFDDEAAQSITDGSDPFSGSYQADNGLFTFDGKMTAGTWQIGVYDGTYTGSNDGSINSWSLNITRMIPDAPPVVDDIPAQTTDEGSSFSTIHLDDYVQDGDHPDDSLSWTYSGNTDLIVSINDNRQATVTIPDENWNGSEIITFTATDPGGYSDSDTVKFTVNPVNDPPVVSDIPDQTIDEGGSFSDIALNDYVSDIDNSDADITWTASGNSELQVNIDSQTHIAHITTPNGDWNGSETITFTATDPGGLSDSDAATFTVNPVNDAPVVSDIPDQTIDEGEEFTDIHLDDYGNDVDNTDAELTWTYSGNVELTVQIDAQTHIAHITIPSTDWVGSETIRFTATDPGGLSDSDAATFTVNAVNDPPVVSDIPDQQTDEGSGFTSIHLDDYVSDPDNSDDEQSWTYTGNQELQVSISPERVATITAPDSNWNGSETIWFKATDPGGLSDSNAAVFTLNPVNDAPQITSTPQTQATQDQLYQYQLTATDADSGDVLRFHLLTAPGFLQIDSLSGLISGTPHNEDVGTHPVQAEVRDSSGATDTQEYQLTVDNQNDPPVVSDIPDQQTDEGNSFTSIHLDDYVSDPDNSDEEQSWTYTGNQELQVSISPERVATVTAPDSNWNGSETITFTATDPGGLSDSDAATFTVNPVNDPPQITSTPQTQATQDQLYQYQLTATDADSGDVLRFHLLTAPGFLQIDSISGLISGTPHNEDVGTHPVQAEVRDSSGATDIQEYQLTVDNQNDPPVVSNIPDQQTDEGNSFTSIHLDDYVSDPDNSDAEQSWTYTGNQELQVSISSERVATITAPDSNWNGSETIWFKATDPGGLSDSNAAVFTLNPVNDAPQITNLPDSLSFTNTETDTIDLTPWQMDEDTADSLLVWQFAVSDTGLKTFYDHSKNELYLSAPYVSGRVMLYLTLIDDSLATDSDSLLVHINKKETGWGDTEAELAGKSKLYPNYPNPFNPATEIRYTVGADGKTSLQQVRLSIFNALGQKVMDLVNERQAAGTYSIRFSATGISSGIYWFRLQVGTGFVQTRKMLLIK